MLVHNDKSSTFFALKQAPLAVWHGYAFTLASFSPVGLACVIATAMRSSSTEWIRPPDFPIVKPDRFSVAQIVEYLRQGGAMRAGLSICPWAS